MRIDIEDAVYWTMMSAIVLISVWCFKAISENFKERRIEAKRWVTICDREKQAEFILTCAKNANPMSDEEGEDLVQQCEWTSSNLFCRKELKEGE